MLNITKPTFVVDEYRVKNNIDKLFNKLAKTAIQLRPHFKTHMSHNIGTWFSEKGITRITVSSVDMAVYFANQGWKDILIAFPVNIKEIDEINRLAKSIKLTLIVDSADVIKFLSENLTNNIHTKIEIDAGYDRSGVLYSNTNSIIGMVEQINNCDMMTYDGILYHDGITYGMNNKDKIVENYNKSLKILTQLKENIYPATGIKSTISVGDTPSAALVNDFGEIDELRPGNFVFYDLMQYFIGSCKDDEIAAALYVPVVGKYFPDKIVVYGGAVHFSKESLDYNGGRIFGAVAEDTSSGWKLTGNFRVISKSSQEHGVIYSEELYKKVSIGDILPVIPVHSCLAASVFNKYYTKEGNELDSFMF